MAQDFSNRISIVIDKGLPTWQAMNTLAHISANFGHYLGENFDTGRAFITANGLMIPRNTQYPIIIFESDTELLQEFAKESISYENVKPMYFIREMIETSNDDEIVESVKGKNFQDVEFLGVGLFGDNTLLKAYTKKFKLWS
jgi:hypothetical protein